MEKEADYYQRSVKLSYIETRKAILATLKDKYPNAKFKLTKITSSSSTSTWYGSINLSWQDGPSLNIIKENIGSFHSEGFDVAGNLPYYYFHYLDESKGTLRFAATRGTEARGGYEPAQHNYIFATERFVKLSNPYIQFNRTFSQEFLDKVAIPIMKNRYGRELGKDFEVSEPLYGTQELTLAPAFGPMKNRGLFRTVTVEIEEVLNSIGI